MSRGFLLNDRRDAFCRKELFGLFALGYFMPASGFLVLEFDTYLRRFLLLTHNSPFRRRYVSNYILGRAVLALFLGYVSRLACRER